MFSDRPPCDCSFGVQLRKPMDSAPTTTSLADKAAATHPLILAAALVWLSVDLIGDGLLALRSLIASATSDRTATTS